MQLGGLAGLTALTMGLGQDRKVKPQDTPESQPNGTAASKPATSSVLVA